MLRSRLADWMVFVGVLLTLASVGLLSSVLADWEHANGSRRMQKLTVNVDRSAASSGSAGLELKEAEQLANKWSPLPIALSAKGQTGAVFGNVTLNSDVFGVNANYRDFAELKMKTGTSILQTSVAEHSRVAVISAQVADKLFRSAQVVGKTIELYGVPFTIIGVYDNNVSLLRHMSDDGVPDVLIPVTAMFDVNRDARIDTVQLAAKPDAAIRGEAQAKDALRAIGANPSLYRIENDLLAHVRITQWRALLLFACGAIALLLLLRLIFRQCVAVYASLRRKLSTHDWPDAIRDERRLLLKCSFAVLAMAACAAGLWELIRFRPYIPLDWIPEQIIDVSFYMEKLRSLWQQQAAQSGYVPSPHELLAGAAGQLAGGLFFTGAVLGLPLFLLGVRLWAMGRMSVSVQLQRLFLYMPVTAAARWAGTDYRIDPLEYAVFCVLFIVAIFHSDKKLKGVKYSHAEYHS
ncbi:ABC transporter permease [Paenibacillus allorhizosphaerae]|uniref:MacB-like periplasmic core domain-containing protein n=1 Tax=Paenibacillus allorhizosphaerae TaxID=2849866 RepID=A0ABN7TIS2_9BACL|nr:ABC transporter permease [Paenibacillus allorhizosphaerae]CAG7633659.1 hypothetical protein PAECIP111802_01970 [Paenibacillus allorhizosphaerae]